MRHVKGGRPSVARWISRILWQRLEGYARASSNSARHSARIVDGFGKSVAGLKAEANSRIVFRGAGLQRMVGGMRGGAHYHYRPESADRMPHRVELGERRKGRVRASVAIGRVYSGEVDSRRTYICGAELHASEIVIDSRRERPDVSVAEMPVNHTHCKQLHFMAWRNCGEVILKSRKIDLCVRGNVSASRSEKRLTLRAVNRRKNLRRERILKRHWNTRQRGDERLENQRKVSGNIILQPQIWKNRSERPPGVKSCVFACCEIQREARSPAV